MNSVYKDVRLLVFALSASMLLHMIVIFALDFRVETREPEPRMLNIQLVPQPTSESENQQAPKPDLDLATKSNDFETTYEPQDLATPPSSSHPGVEVVESQLEAQVVSEHETASYQATVEDLSVLSQTVPDPNPPLSIQDMISAATEIARNQSTKQNVRNITHSDATNTEEEYYLKAWLKKVQEVGQLNYPQEAVEKKLYGKLRLYVSLKSDGSVQETRVLRSSGHVVLDEAAIHIVELAAPFSPFPKAMRESIDLLEIVREWEFRKEALIPSQLEEDRTD